MSDPNAFIPVVYTVKAKENLYRIAKVYFQQDIEQVKLRNGLSDNNLTLNQELVIGYFKFQNVSGGMPSSDSYAEALARANNQSGNVVSPSNPAVTPNTKVETPTNNPANVKPGQMVVENNMDHTSKSQVKTEVEKVEPYRRGTETETETVTETITEPNAKGYVTDEPVAPTVVEPIKVESDPNKVTEVTEVTEQDVVKAKPAVALRSVKRKGIAFWDKKSKNRDRLMVLHKDAAVNTKITIRNPLTRRSVVADVVANIPKNMYQSDVDVVISPAVAKSIGILDERLQVEMTYKRK